MNNTWIVVWAILLRLLFVLWISQSETSEKLVLTDIDYKVYSQAAEYMAEGGSPYDRHTYRYTPFLATLMQVNQYFGFSAGKYIFILFDLLSLLIIQRIFRNSKVPLALYGLNPILIYVTARGSCEAINSFLMFLFVLLQPSALLAGTVYGFWIHFRMYPIIFFIPLLICYFKKQKSTKFMLGSAIGFVPIVLLYYLQYGYQFIDETYLYHLNRVDNRHNLSAYFYLTYLTMGQPKNYIHEMFKILPMAYLFVMIMKKYHTNIRLTIFLMTYVFVLFNRVLTVQYYMWIFSSLVLVINASMFVTQKKWRALLHMFCVWMLGVLTWVWVAEKIEGKGENMFYMMWVICLARMLGQTWIFVRLIWSFQAQQLKNEQEESSRIKSQ